MRQKCCAEAASTQATVLFPNGNTPLSDRVNRRIVRVISRWGALPEQALTTGPHVIAVDDPGFLNALSLPFECRSGHSDRLIAISARVIEFIRLINLAVADYFELDAKLGALVGREDLARWPDDKAIRRLVEALRLFYGVTDTTTAAESVADGGDLGEVAGPLGQFDSYDGVHKFSAFIYSHIVDLAELYVLYHEVFHIVPDDARIALPEKYFVSGEQKRRWLIEFNCDASALYLLVVTATMRFFDTIDDKVEARRTGLALGTVAADAALHALLVIERLQYGELNEEAASQRDEFKRHPPALSRRGVMSHYSVNVFRAAQIPDFESFRSSIASSFKVRDDLFVALPKIEAAIPEPLRIANWIS
jgi:hypothetical protein